MRPRSLADLAGVAALSLLLGWLVSLATTRVVNWFVMTDELYYLRLAVSVAQTGSPLPRLHGEVIANVNQLYPLLLSPFFGDANVPASLAAAHRLNAFLMASAAVPVYLLARRIGVGRLAGAWVSLLAVAVPWIVLASFLLTEVVAYPAFCWAVLGLVHAVDRKSNLADALAVAGMALAVLARTQFVFLPIVLALAVAVEAVVARQPAKDLVRQRPVLTGVYALGLVVLGVAAVTGNVSDLLGSYAVTLQDLQIDVGLLELLAEHVAVLALGLAILPFLVGVAWLLDRLRASAPPKERAFALVGLPALVLLILEVASFDQRFGADQVKDRYLFYAVPILLVAVAAALRGGRSPWWAYAAPGAVCAIGFATLALPRYEKLNVDSVLAMLNDTIVGLATSEGWGRVMLVVATLVALEVILLASTLVPFRVLALTALALLTIALPAQGVYAFERLFRVNGTNGLPITLDQGGVFNWVDRALGKEARVSMLRYPVNPPDYYAGIGYWWDLEFWNESVVDTLDEIDGPGEDPWLRFFDRKTGAAASTGKTPFVYVYGNDVRFRLAGKQLAYDRGAYLFQAAQPWRAAWVAEDIYNDGWTRPHRPARITVFAEPGQRTPVKRFLTFAVASPDSERPRPVEISSNLADIKASVFPNSSLDQLVTVCVPPGGSSTVTVDTPLVSLVYRDPTQGPLTGEVDRPTGVLLRSIALADEIEPMERCP